VWVIRLPAVLPSSAASLAVAVGHLKQFPGLAQPPVSARLDLLQALKQVNEESNLYTTMDLAIQACDKKDRDLLKILDSKDAAEVEPACKKYLEEALASSKPGKAMSHSMIATLAERALSLQSWPTLELVMESQVFSARSLPNVVSVLVEHKQTRCLELCVAFVHDLDEAHLVQVLQYALGQSPPLLSLVNDVLAARHSDSFLHDALKSLSSDAFSLLLAHLVRWLSKYWKEVPPEEMLAVSLPQVVNWCNILLDSSFVDLILPSSPCHQQLAALRQAVSRHMALANALSQSADLLKALCSSIELKRAGQKVEPQPAIADYSVELLLL
jgi:hypothetical protein